MTDQIEVYNYLEEVEVEAWASLYRSANRLNPIPGGVKSFRHGAALLTMVPDCDVLALNRVLGLGSDGQADQDSIARIVEAYRVAGAKRFFVQLPPNADRTVADLLVEAGFEHYNNWVKLHRTAAALEHVESDLRVEQIGAEHSESFARIIGSCFDWGESLISWIGAVVGRPDWHCYLAFEGDRPAATGGFFKHGNSAWIDLAATLPEYRGRGAQSKLLQKRFEDILALGCTDIVVETAQPTDRKEAPSHRNMVRYGFREAYVRPNYLYKF